jgi:uncharacterized membrane protein (UPF0127 family)
MGLSLIRKADQISVLSDGVYATRYWTRLRGLIGTRELKLGEGMLFPKCNSVHMWMMSIPLDIVFLKTVIPSKEWTVVDIRSNVKPWKLLPFGCFQANDVLELPAGTTERLALKPGEILCIA